MNEFLGALRRYADFGGRSGRKEYWYFLIANLLIFLLLSRMDEVTGQYSELFGIGLLSGIFTLAMVIPATAVATRRLHDTDRGAGWLLLSLIPLAGALVLMIFAAQDGTPGSNRFGPPAP